MFTERSFRRTGEATPQTGNTCPVSELPAWTGGVAATSKK